MTSRARSFLLAVGVALSVQQARAFEPLDFGVQPFNPCLPLFDGGPLTNLGEGGAAWTNASAHVAWSLAIPLGARALWGRRGMWIAGLSWMGASVLQEAFFHAPPGGGGPAYPSEVRTDLITRLLPTAIVLVWDAIHGDAPEVGTSPEPERVARARGGP